MSDATPDSSSTNRAGKLVDELKLGLRRFVQGDFQQVKASEGERARLARAPRPVDDPLAQDYTAWRKSMLVMAAVMLILAAGFKVIKYQSLESDLVESHMESSRQQGQEVSEERARQDVRKIFGVDNIETLEVANYLDIFTLLFTTVLTLLAARSWSSVRSSRRLARRAWYVWILVPVGMALIPWSGLLDFGHLPAGQAAALKGTLGVVMGVAMTVFLGPKILSIFPGLIRSALILKTLVPETSLPAWLAAICAPIYMLMLVLVVALINQTSGDALLLIGTLCLMLAPFSYLRYMRSLLRPLDGPTAADRVRKARLVGYVLNAIGGLLLFIFVLNMEMLSWDVALEMFAAAVGGLLLMMVVSSDFMLAVLRVSFQQAGELYGTEMATRLEERLKVLTASGLTELRTPAEEGGGPTSSTT